MSFLSFLLGLAVGVAAVIVYNIFKPEKVAKATRELSEEVDKLKS